MYKALVVPPKAFTTREWEYALKRRNLLQHPRKGSGMLDAIGDGMVFARGRFAAALGGFSMPSIAIPTADPDGDLQRYEGKCGYDSVNNAVVVTPSWLDTLSKLPFDQLVAIGERGEVSFRGYLLDYCFFAGVEEFDHACYRHEYGERDVRASLSGSLGDCDATNIEWRALCRLLEIAQDPELNFPEITRRIFQSRIAAAAIIREKLQ